MNKALSIVNGRINKFIYFYLPTTKRYITSTQYDIEKGKITKTVHSYQARTAQ